MNRFFGHLRVICVHKWYVFRGCVRCGLFWQGLTHDLSKFSPEEFIPSLHYFRGDRSPIGEERRLRGFSEAWLHHKGRNKHHWEYWVDFLEDGSENHIRMPERYFKEMICDWIAAGKAYNGKNWTQKHPLRYFTSHEKYYQLHPETRALAETVLRTFDEEGEDAAFALLKTLRYPDRKESI